MTREKVDLKDLKQVVSKDEPVINQRILADDKHNEAPVYERTVDKQGRSYATGKRKDSIARVWVKPGTGKFTINNKPQDEYFKRATLRMVIEHPFAVVDRKDKYDVVCTIVGGGLSGQAGALCHGISKALVLQEPEVRSLLKKEGLITRDSRVVERKKYGRKKARKSFQFSKR